MALGHPALPSPRGGGNQTEMEICLGTFYQKKQPREIAGLFFFKLRIK